MEHHVVMTRRPSPSHNSLRFVILDYLRWGISSTINQYRISFYCEIVPISLGPRKNMLTNNFDKDHTWSMLHQSGIRLKNIWKFPAQSHSHQRIVPFTIWRRSFWIEKKTREGWLYTDLQAFQYRSSKLVWRK